MLEPSCSDPGIACDFTLEDDIDAADGERRAKQPAPLERRIRGRQAGEQWFGNLGHQRTCVIERVGCNRTATTRVPRLEEPLKDFVDEPSTRARRESRFVFWHLLESKHVRGEELERTVLIPFERTQGIRWCTMRARPARLPFSSRA